MTPSWKQLIKNPSFRKKLIIGLILVAIILGFLPHFFQYIELRRGYVLQDFVLKHLPAVDVSIPVFTIIWALVIFFAVRSSKDPILFLMYLYSFLILFAMRIITIYV